MPWNDKKIVSIILRECDGLEERFDGYRHEITAAVADILQYERQHRVSATNIQKKINEKCNATARLLLRKVEKRSGGQRKRT